MDSQIVVLIISFLGFFIIIFCILSFFLPYGNKFKEKIQKIKGFGVDLQISVLTLFLIIGVILSLSSVYLQVKDYEDKLKKAQKEEKAAKIALSHANKIEMRVVVSLEETNETNTPRLENIQCKYFLPGTDKYIKADVIKGVGQGTFKIILKEVTSMTHILRLVLEDKTTNRKWEKINFMPLEPIFTLKKE